MNTFSLKKKQISSKGITLIALVITIIVLLILAGISIAMLTGENGILTKADTATRETEIADAKEQAKLDIMSWTADRMQDGESTTLNDEIVKGIITGKEYVKEAKDTSFTTKKSGYEIMYDELYNKPKPPIPEGFYEVGGTIETGFVISDVPDDDLENSKHGNQFVWVPVPDITKFKTVEGYAVGELDNALESCSEPFFGEEDTTELVKENYDNMVKSVKDNHGFYIGRFESGKDENGNVIVKKGANVYNNIHWGNAMTEITSTDGAVALSKEFASKQGYTSVTSTLVYGVQWDATMQFMDSNYYTGECDESSYVRDSTDKGYYSADAPTTTGSNPNYAVKNIYDMAGNVWEWTMEAGYWRDYIRISRGGSYENDGSSFPASVRKTDDRGTDANIWGFRIALYL